MDFNAAINKIAFVIVHGSSLWFLTGLLAASLASWRLAVILSAHSARGREAALAKNTAIFYAVSAVGLWLLSWLLG